ncbi:MAG: hypothetical protein KGJ86_07495 [Chloroflexota bacterium]|nr:hypothetical protein [Chloroflexota bacterium]
MKAIAWAMGVCMCAVFALTACGRDNVAQVKAAIERANHEQEDAFTAHNPDLMADTSTAQNFAVMVRSNEDIAAAGVVNIKLDKLEWGEINVLSPDAATATTWETWDSTFSDGQTISDRERNDYKLVKIGQSWKIDEIHHPDSEAQPGATPAPTASAG